MAIRSLALVATLVLVAACSDSVLDTSQSEDELAAATPTPGEPLAFDIPTDALGFTIAATWPPNVQGNEHGIRSLVSPSGRAVVHEFTPERGTLPSARVTRGTASFAVPSTTPSLAEPVGGRWTAVVDGPPGATITLRVQRAAGGRFAGGFLDLDLYVPDGLVMRDPEPARSIDATAAASDANVQARVDIFFRFLAEHVGIGRGIVRYHRIDSRYLSATTGDARAELLSAARDAHAGLAVVLTNELAYGQGAPLLGYSVGLPGLLDAAGRPHGAIAVATNGKQATAENDALTLFHELGHFAGLRHTTDDDGTLDLLDDTPACVGTKQCPDATNLMASDGPAGGLALSPSQVRVFQGAPIYRAVR